MAEETPQQKQAGANGAANIAAALERFTWPRDAMGTPLVRISAASAELVPTVQYGNATIGPVIVERFVPDGDEEAIKVEIKKLQKMVETAVAEDRQTLHEQIRAQASAS
jgi:hypothetical protein